MKHKSLILLLAAVSLSSISTQVVAEEKAKKNYVVGQLGLYQPLTDLEDADFDTGAQVGVGYGRYLNEHLLFETSVESFAVDRDVSGFSSTAGSYSRDDYMYASGILVTLKGEYSTGNIDFYGGGGIGIYGATLDSEVDSNRLGSFDKDDFDTVFGVHAVLGITYNITETIFTGLEGKYRWTGDIEHSETVASIPIEYEGDLSGYSVAATLGFRF